MITKTLNSLNNETPLEALSLTLTPPTAFYTRSHFEVLSVDTASWRLIVEREELQGKSHALEFTLDDLRKMPQKIIVATLECAGNGRSGFKQTIDGEVQWGEGAVATASWTGIPLSYLLSMCGLRDKSQANTIYFEGMDLKGRESGKSIVMGQEDGSRFVRYLNLKKALDTDTLIALKMNGADLSPEHGYPCRLIVPDWYAMASVKWLARIRVAKDNRPHAYFNDVKYVYNVPSKDGGRLTKPVTEIRVKSIINTPSDGQHLVLNEPVIIRGKAWSGSGRITRVKIRAGSNGAEWADAEIDAKQSSDLGRHAWTIWSMKWIPRKVGPITLFARATDESGNTQPELPMLNSLQYGYNATSKITVDIATGKLKWT